MWNCSCCCRLWHWPTAVVCSVYSAVSVDTNAQLFSSHRELYYYVVTGFNQVWCAEAFIQDFTADDDERSEDDDSLVDHCLITETTLRLYCHSTRREWRLRYHRNIVQPFKLQLTTKEDCKWEEKISDVYRVDSQEVWLCYYIVFPGQGGEKLCVRSWPNYKHNNWYK